MKHIIIPEFLYRLFPFILMAGGFVMALASESILQVFTGTCCSLYGIYVLYMRGQGDGW